MNPRLKCNTISSWSRFFKELQQKYPLFYFDTEIQHHLSLCCDSFYNTFLAIKRIANMSFEEISGRYNEFIVVYGVAVKVKDNKIIARNRYVIDGDLNKAIRLIKKHAARFIREYSDFYYYSESDYYYIARKIFKGGKQIIYLYHNQLGTLRDMKIHGCKSEGVDHRLYDVYKIKRFRFYQADNEIVMRKETRVRT